MHDKRLTLEVSTQAIAACSICCANNFEDNEYAVGERVDRLYELQISSQTMTLCDKCLDRLRETLAQRFDAEGKREAADGQIVLFTGTEFIATDKLRQTGRYRMIGAEVSHDGLIRLLNLNTDALTYVEPAWFRQRKIKVLQKDKGFYDSAGGYHEGGRATGPDGVYCGECGEPSCAGCGVWRWRRGGQE